jgi:DNA-binding NtrC family response regulator
MRMDAWQSVGRGLRVAPADHLASPSAEAEMPCRLIEGDRFVGSSAATSRLRQMIARLGAASATTLIHGETGTGKEIVALLLHRNSPRAAKALVPINCAAIPEAMIEGELFGYEKGAFSSAIRAYPGKFGLADGGTLFLDEIGELSLAAQAKILRALEAKEVFPLGSMRPRRCNVRIIAATNRDLAAEVRAGRFRADLYYRLAVVRLDIPPLAARREDIAPIAVHLVVQLARELGCRVPVIAPAAIAELQRRDWPGNVRELRNALEHALVVADNPGLLGAADLPPALQDMAMGDPSSRGGPEALRYVATSSAAILTRDRVIDAIRACDGQKAQAARMLRVSRTTLYRYLQRQSGMPATA